MVLEQIQQMMFVKVYEGFVGDDYQQNYYCFENVQQDFNQIWCNLIYCCVFCRFLRCVLVRIGVMSGIFIGSFICFVVNFLEILIGSVIVLLLQLKEMCVLVLMFNFVVFVGLSLIYGCGIWIWKIGEC